MFALAIAAAAVAVPVTSAGAINDNGQGPGSHGHGIEMHANCHGIAMTQGMRVAHVKNIVEFSEQGYRTVQESQEFVRELCAALQQG